jgi:hypothetical protein
LEQSLRFRIQTGMDSDKVSQSSVPSSIISSPSANGFLRTLVLVIIASTICFLLRRQLRQFFYRYFPFPLTLFTRPIFYEKSIITSSHTPAKLLLVTNNRSGGGLGLAISTISSRMQNGPVVIPLELRILSKALREHLHLTSRSMRLRDEKRLSSSSLSSSSSSSSRSSGGSNGSVLSHKSINNTSDYSHLKLNTQVPVQTIMMETGLGNSSPFSPPFPLSPALRIVCAGGDGTISGIVHLLCELGISTAVSLAVMPLGTGNDVAKSLGLQGSPPAVNIESLSSFFDRAASSPTRRVDVYSVSFSVHSEGSIHVLRSGVETVLPEREVRGSSLLYTSVGLDAELVWEVEKRRQRHRYLNKLLYALVGASFIITRLREKWLTSSSREKKDGELEEIIIDGERVAAENLPSSLVSLLALSSPSYAGGTTVWPTTWSMDSNIYEKMRPTWNKKPSTGNIVELPVMIETLLRYISLLPLFGKSVSIMFRSFIYICISPVRRFYPWFLNEPWSPSSWDDGKFELIGAKSLFQISGAVGTKTGLFGGLLRIAQPSSFEAVFKRPPESLRSELAKVELGTPIAEPEMVAEEDDLDELFGDKEIDARENDKNEATDNRISTNITSNSSSSSSSSSSMRRKQRGFATLHTLAISAPTETITITTHMEKKESSSSPSPSPLSNIGVIEENNPSPLVSLSLIDPPISPQRVTGGALAYLSPSSHPAVGKLLGLRGRTTGNTNQNGHVLPFSNLDTQTNESGVNTRSTNMFATNSSSSSIKNSEVKPVFIQVDGEAYKVYGLLSLRIEIKNSTNLVVPTAL